MAKVKCQQELRLAWTKEHAEALRRLAAGEHDWDRSVRTGPNYKVPVVNEGTSPKKR